MILSYLIGAHLIGDFLLQNHWMQRKGEDSFVCTIHVGCYAFPFFVLWLYGLTPLWMIWSILAQHWLQDRFSLHRKWMTFYSHTTPDKWPVGPLCIDQSMHIGFMWLITLLPL